MGTHPSVLVAVAGIVILGIVGGGIGIGIGSQTAVADESKDLLAPSYWSTFTNDNGKGQAPTVELPRALEFDNGTNYIIEVHDEDHGGTIAVRMPVEGTAAEGSQLILFLPKAGTINGRDALWLRGEALSTGEPTDIPVTVRGEVATTGIVNLSVSVVDARTGETVFRTETQPYIVNYQERISQAGTTGRVSLAVDRSVLPRNTTLTGLIYSANHTFPPGANGTTRVNFTYDQQRDAFVTTVPTSELEAGNYRLSLSGDLPSPYGTSFEHVTRDVIRIDSSNTGEGDRTGGQPAVVGTALPGDPDDDGLYEDVNGDGAVTPGDVTVLFNAVFEQDPAVTENVDSFDFNGDGSVTPGDATVLFDEMF